MRDSDPVRRDRSGRSPCGSTLPRRDFLLVGALGGLGLSLETLLASEKTPSPAGQPARPEPRARSVIQIFLPGGMAAQETLDPKPHAPLEYRGDLGHRPTKLEGVRLGASLERLAGVLDKTVVCRSMSHGEAAHERGTHNMFTGYRPSPALVFPSLGSVVSHELGGRNDLPPYVCIPSQPGIYAGSGYLSSSHAPFSLGSDPASGGFQVRDLGLPGGVDADRFTRRRSILEAVNEHFRQKETSDGVQAMDSFYERAYSLISSPAARDAFRIEKEPDSMRDAYGRNPAGQRMLLARRLVEAGVRLVTLTYGGWDMHQNILDGMKRQLPPLDQALAQLIADLDQRGLLDSTLVLLTTEFGRTPKINRDAGRDHWPRVFSILMAGGGLRRGHVHGSSDPTSTEPQDDPLSVEDWATTVYHLLGIDASRELIAPGDRPIEIVNGGRVLEDLIA